MLIPRSLLMLTGFLGLATTPGAAQNRQAWEFYTRLLATGTSRASEPAGFKVYTAFPLEISLRRHLGPHWSLELSGRNESREVDQAQSPTPIRVGSIECLPFNLTVQYRFRPQRRLRPYLGGGLNATVAWEKAGTIDSMNVAPSLGPALQAGLDLALNGYLDFNLDYRWNSWTTTIESPAGVRLA